MLFLDTLSVTSFLKMRDKISPPYINDKQNYYFEYLTFMFLENSQEHKSFWGEWQ